MISEPTSNDWIKVTKRKNKDRFTSKPTLHNRKFHPRIQIKKGTTRDISHQMVYGTKACKQRPHIYTEYKSTKASSYKKLLNRKDHHHRHHQQVDVSKAFLTTILRI
jgi:hypothetical protein